LENRTKQIISTNRTKENIDEYRKVEKIFKESSSDEFLKNFEIEKVELIWNKNLERMFEGQMIILQERSHENAFQSTWKTEELKVDHRQQVMERLKQLISKFSPQPKDVNVIPLWHGTKSHLVPKICSSGFAALQLTDSGYFGKGIYATNSAEYAGNIYSGNENVLLLCWTLLGNTFPVVKEDMHKLQGKAAYKNYDTHFIPVISPNPNDSNAVVYLPCDQNQIPKYYEFVFFSSSQLFPRYVVHYKKIEPPKQSSIPTKSISNKDSKNWSCDQLCQQLNNLNLSQDYSPIFHKNAIDGDIFMDITTPDEWNKIGITIFGDVKRILRYQQELK